MTSFEEHPSTSSTKEEGGSNKSLNTLNINNSDNSHSLSDTWILWAHLPHDTDWSIKSYTRIYEFNTLEQAVTITEMLPPKLIINCMLFLMRQGVKPIWEDPKNRNGGCFSYKISNKSIFEAWKEICYALVGDNISKTPYFVRSVTGITVSPKKNFCILKIWLTNCDHQNPTIVNPEIKSITSTGCLFKKHVPEY